MVTPYLLDSPSHCASRLKPPLNNYLYRLGHGDHTVARDMAAPPAPTRLFHVGDGPVEPIPEDLLATTRSRFCLRETRRLDEFWVRSYDAVTPPLPTAGEVEPTSCSLDHETE